MYSINLSNANVTTLKEAKDTLGLVMNILNLVSCFCHEDMKNNKAIYELWEKCGESKIVAYQASQIVENLMADVAIPAQA